MHKTWTDFTICLFFLPLLLAHHTLSTHHSFTAILSIWSTFFLIFCLDSNEQQHKNIKNQNQPKKKGKPFHCEDHGIEATPHITTRSTSANLSANNHESTDDYCLLKFEPSDCSYLCKDPKKKPQKTQQIKPINKQRTLSNSSTRYLSVARTHIHSHSLNIRVFVSIYSILWDIWFSVLYLIVCVCACAIFVCFTFVVSLVLSSVCMCSSLYRFDSIFCRCFDSVSLYKLYVLCAFVFGWFWSRTLFYPFPVVSAFVFVCVFLKFITLSLFLTLSLFRSLCVCVCVYHELVCPDNLAIFDWIELISKTFPKYGNSKINWIHSIRSLYYVFHISHPYKVLSIQMGNSTNCSFILFNYYAVSVCHRHHRHLLTSLLSFSISFQFVTHCTCRDIK